MCLRFPRMSLSTLYSLSLLIPLLSSSSVNSCLCLCIFLEYALNLLDNPTSSVSPMYVPCPRFKPLSTLSPFSCSSSCPPLPSSPPVAPSLILMPVCFSLLASVSLIAHSPSSRSALESKQPGALLACRLPVICLVAPLAFPHFDSVILLL